MVDLFADVPEEMALNTLQTIRRNLDQYLMEVLVKAQEKAA